MQCCGICLCTDLCQILSNDLVLLGGLVGFILLLGYGTCTQNNHRDQNKPQHKLALLKFNIMQAFLHKRIPTALLYRTYH